MNVNVPEPLPSVKVPSHSIVPWIVLATGLPAAGYVLVNLLSHPPPAAPASPPVEAGLTRVTPVEPDPIPTATTETAAETNTNTRTWDETELRFRPDTAPAPAPAPDHEAEIAVLRHEIATALDRAEEDLRGERFDNAVQEFESAARSAQTYPDAFWRERDRIASLRTRLIEARVAAEINAHRDALWRQRVANIEQSLSDRKWPEARRDAEEIVNDAQAPPAIANRARELLQQAKEGLVSAFRQTEVSGTTNTTIRKPSSPPRKHE